MDEACLIIGQVRATTATSTLMWEVVRALLSAGAMVDLQFKGGLSLLHFACWEGHMEVICALLSGGAKVDLQKNNAGISPLHTVLATWGLSMSCYLQGPGQTCVTRTAGRPWTHCSLLCAQRWSTSCSKPRRRGAAPWPIRAE